MTLQCVRINGVNYDSVKEAAETNGVSVYTIHSAIERGAEHTVGVGTGALIRRSVVIDGKTFASIAEASRETGMTRHQVRWRNRA